LGLLKLPLSIEQADNARAAAAIVDALQTDSLGSHRQRVFLGSQEIRIVRQRLQDVRDLPESLQYRLLVVSGGSSERSERGAAFSLSHAGIEDRLRKARGDTPYHPGRVE
jgi:hypothetical protein